MTSKGMLPAAAGAVAVAALLGGCGLGFGDEMIGSASATGTQAGPVVPEPPTGSGPAQQSGGGGSGSTTPSSSSPSGSGGSGGTGGSAQPSSGSRAAGVTEVRTGTWDVGDAGQVQFAVRQGQLQLLAATPASGWQQAQPPTTQPDAIEVVFGAPLGTKWTFQVQLSGSTMQITKQKTVAKAADGSYPVGAAGSVDFISSGSQLKLTSVTPEGGWSVTQRESTPTSISVSFKQAAGTAQFTAAISGTDVSVTTSQQLSGPVPTK